MYLVLAVGRCLWLSSLVLALCRCAPVLVRLPCALVRQEVGQELCVRWLVRCVLGSLVSTQSSVARMGMGRLVDVEAQVSV